MQTMRRSLPKDPATERAELIARKYSGEELSSKDEARLPELSELVQALFPRVTERDWQILREIEARLDETEERTAEARRKYGLNG